VAHPLHIHTLLVDLKNIDHSYSYKFLKNLYSKSIVHLVFIACSTQILTDVYLLCVFSFANTSKKKNRLVS
jgi:hypothetical protein